MKRVDFSNSSFQYQPSICPEQSQNTVPSTMLSVVNELTTKQFTPVCVINGELRKEIEKLEPVSLRPEEVQAFIAGKRNALVSVKKTDSKINALLKERYTQNQQSPFAISRKNNSEFFGKFSIVNKHDNTIG